VVVAGRREDAKDVVHLLLRVLLAGDGGDFGEVDLVAQLGLGLVLVERQAVGAQDDVDGLPLLPLSVHGAHVIVWRGGPTLVFRVRFSTEPALMMRSNSKQPFWFTGDMTPALSACAWMLERRGCAGVLGVLSVLSFMGEGAGARVTGIGLAGVCCAPSAILFSLHQVAGGRRYVAGGLGSRGGSCVVVELVIFRLL
jgi:hypothetical protein